MRRMKKAVISVCLAFCLIAAAGCKNNDEMDSQYKLYRINQDGTGLVETAYQGETEDTDKAVREMIEALKDADDTIEVQPAIPKNVKLESYVLEDEKLMLYFNEEYGKMDTVQEVLCRAALVRSLTQLEGVEQVAFYVNGEPLTSRSGEEYGFLQAEDFVQNTGSAINSFQDTVLTLYFANRDGTALVKEDVSVRYNSNQAKERVIVERLIKGPTGTDLQATIPKGTKLLSASIKDGICYLNFNEGLKNTTPGVRPETVIFSIVNSVTESGAVSRVQIAINGDSNVLFQESIKLSEPLSRNLDIMEEE
ncbi:MAG: GerMN domain-containing protein [Bariatricus sp.]